MTLGTEQTEMRCSVFIASSLDGFIARTDGNIDWLEQMGAVTPPGEDCGFAAYMATVDAIVMGRGTFEKVCSFPKWPYEKPVYVLSSSLGQIDGDLANRVSLLNADPSEVIKRAREEGFRHLYIDGGKTIQGFLRAGLISDITLSTIPTLIGTGIRLFGDIPADIHLKLLSTTTYPFGVVQTKYRIIREA